MAAPKAKQSLGQNFLQDDGLARRLVGALEGGPASEEGRRVLEFGPGQGALTGHLLHAFPRMTAVEIDGRMVELLRTTLPELSLVHEDLLALDLETLAARLGGRLSIISNTPFYLTSQLLFKLLGEAEHVDEAVLTMQQEVAHKVLAPHGCKQYGIISVMLQLFGGCDSILFDIPPAAFSPEPKCTVSVLRLRPTAVPAGGDAALSRVQRARLLGLLKLAFEQRRKMLRHTLKPLLAEAATPPPDEWLRMRPEQLPPAAFVELTSCIFGEDCGGGAESDDDSDDAALSRIAGSHRSRTWSPQKAGWAAPLDPGDVGQ